MQEETFGPVVGIQKVDASTLETIKTRWRLCIKVSSDEEAIELMNDSPYGLTASVWTDAQNPESEKAFMRFVDELETGTVFMNRSDRIFLGMKCNGLTVLD